MMKWSCFLLTSIFLYMGFKTTIPFTTYALWWPRDKGLTIYGIVILFSNSLNFQKKLFGHHHRFILIIHTNKSSWKTNSDKILSLNYKYFLRYRLPKSDLDVDQTGIGWVSKNICDTNKIWHNSLMMTICTQWSTQNDFGNKLWLRRRK